MDGPSVIRCFVAHQTATNHRVCVLVCVCVCWCMCALKIWIPDEIEEGTYFINVPFIFDAIVEYLKQKTPTK